MTTLPTVSATGQAAAPLLGVEGVLMSARAASRRRDGRDPGFSPATPRRVARAVAARQVVANRGAYDDPAVAGDTLAAFQRQAEVSVPMPSALTMRLVDAA
ncbi:MAG: hypothetical protein R2939_12645 [Kofleriaceae bacterium]